ncbi:MAG: NUDIX domain-containing protein [Actinomycetota bacterium]|nr:NUDIX domain-containing protein [Actinomycetota bacterium]
MDAAFPLLAADVVRELSSDRETSAVGRDQGGLWEEFLRVARGDPSSTWRDGPADHFTASMFVFDAALERVCLVLHKKVGRWLQPGGHLEAGDATVGSAAAREAHEETGLLGLALLPGVVHLSHHALNSNFGSCRSHLDVRFAAVAAQDTVPVCSAESQDVQWWPVDALPPDTDDELRTVIPRIRDQLLEAHPLH